jgi:hypothetical protein
MGRTHFLFGACCALATTLIMSFTPAPEVTLEYKAVQPGADIEKTLNTWAGYGWRLHSYTPGGVMIFEKGAWQPK